MIVEGGAVPALVKHLQAPPILEGDRGLKPFEHEVEKGSAFALGLLAVKVKFNLFRLYISFPVIISVVCIAYLGFLEEQLNSKVHFEKGVKLF